MSIRSFSDIPPTPWGHFQLHFYLAILRLVDQVAHYEGSLAAALERFPFLSGYFQELADRGVEADGLGQAIGDWRLALTAWAEACPAHLPLRAWQEAMAVEPEWLDWFFLAGLVEEDARFGHLFAALQGTPGEVRPTVGLLSTWQPAEAWNLDVRAQIRRLETTGLLASSDDRGPRTAHALQAPGLLWDVVRGQAPTSPGHGLTVHEPGDLPRLKDLILPKNVVASLQRLPHLMKQGDVQLVLVRGPGHNGRHTLLQALARALQLSTIELQFTKASEARLLLGNLALMLPAMPIVRADLAPGETLELPNWFPYRGPVGVALGDQGGVSDPVDRRSFTMRLPLPEPALRRHHWQRSSKLPLANEGAVARRFRLTSGNIYRAARLAQTVALLEGATALTGQHIQQATRSLNRQALDTLATYLPAAGDWSYLAISPDTEQELLMLEARCRQREKLPGAVNRVLATQLNAGVRALFSGPSGTGKTLAARLLAGALGQDLYRLDLSAVVNKYIGETEKNLELALARAEELDVILLLDEGDALLTKRTGVNTANDRYANLETNYLLQRLESFAGILLITTNAMDRIDGAFERRMDMVVEFRRPEGQERWRIWQLHLPDDHKVSESILELVAGRCELTGGQIRNAALQATLLALEQGKQVAADHLFSAVRQEYRKQGALCPLPALNGRVS